MLIDKPFFLMRHGQTFANKEGLTCGMHDSALTKKGKIDIEHQGKLFNLLNIKPSLIFHSGLSRSKETAIIVNQFIDSKLIEKPMLNEQKFGAWDLYPWTYIREKLDNNQSPPHGESRNKFSTRIKNCLNDILINTPNSTFPLIVGHGGTFFAIGWIYGCMVKDIQNSDIYFFSPSSQKKFPWNTFKVTKDNQSGLKKDNIYFPINQLT